MFTFKDIAPHITTVIPIRRDERKTLVSALVKIFVGGNANLLYDIQDETNIYVPNLLLKYSPKTRLLEVSHRKKLAFSHEVTLPDLDALDLAMANLEHKLQSVICNMDTTGERVMRIVYCVRTGLTVTNR